MYEQAVKKPYMVSVHEPEDEAGALVFAFVPSGLNGIPRRMPQFIVAVRHEKAGLTFDWSGSPDDPGAAREEIQAEIAVRMNARVVWIDRVTALVSQVEEWARELNWATRRLDKKIEDPWIGKYQVPALLMQEDTCRMLLEPIARSAPGVEGVVDLYLMPAYDDIAVLFYYSNRWNLHYNMARRTNAVVPVGEADAMPLTKETLAKVLAELQRNAA